MNKIILSLSSIALLVMCSGCGDNEQEQKLIGELQDRVKKLETQLKEAQAANNAILVEIQEGVTRNNASINSLKGELQKRHQSLINSMTRSQSAMMRSTAATTQQSPVATTIAPANQDKETLRLTSMISSMVRSRPLNDVVNMLNQRKMFGPDKQPWDQKKLIDFMRKNRVNRLPAPAPK